VVLPGPSHSHCTHSCPVPCGPLATTHNANPNPRDGAQDQDIGSPDHIQPSGPAKLPFGPRGRTVANVSPLGPHDRAAGPRTWLAICRMAPTSVPSKVPTHLPSLLPRLLSPRPASRPLFPLKSRRRTYIPTTHDYPTHVPTLQACDDNPGCDLATTRAVAIGTLCMCQCLLLPFFRATFSSRMLPSTINR
jgi:hypothetical protein